MKSQISNLKSQNSKGFTLVELLVVIFIITILSAVVIVSLGRARIKSRDNRRKSDLAVIQQALEMYYADEHSFPPGYYRIADTIPEVAPEFPEYLSPIHQDPSGDFPYLYRSRKAGGDDYVHYIILSTLENEEDSDYSKPIEGYWATVPEPDASELNTRYGEGKDYHYYVSSD